MKTTFLFTLLSLSINSFAGASAAVFNCVSDSGRTKLSASVPGDFEEHEVDLMIDGKAVKYYSLVNQTTYQMEENSSVYVLGSLNEKNYHFLVTSKKGEKLFTFSAIPSTIKVKSSEYGESGSLKAKLTGVDPRTDNKLMPEITVSCTYQYEI
ncbi:hypothetical protein HBN50_10895 [Halobacteriovorax sp. GB3]|uniref:hypothetical protein n=1 Tax=Halobacteriovorax sp. GB3 TaxID=2719615 RepID=UPI0023606647|nr:hypothetical protein [Halobacteriovorax sp. GB3]MDD0853610.1 hypothetical protein [Halobacteriovorax sp. GB3]